jgi:uncharacterized protein with PIN domain
MIAMPPQTEQLARLLALKSGRTPEEVVKQAIEAKAREAGVLPSEHPQRRRPDLQARLNLSDCAAYALARTPDTPLSCSRAKISSATDIRSAAAV